MSDERERRINSIRDYMQLRRVHQDEPIMPLYMGEELLSEINQLRAELQQVRDSWVVT